MASLVVRGDVLTFDPATPARRHLVIRDGLVAVDAGQPPPAEVIEVPPGGVALPGFIDPHVHLLAAAAAVLSVDCSADAAPSLDDIVTQLRRAAAALPAGTWIRAHGYDEAFLPERTHPTRAMIDAVSRSHPIVVHHATGHVAVVNSAAMHELGITEPLDGILVDAHAILTRVPQRDPADMRRALAAVGHAMAAAGVTTVGDATVTNGAAELAMLRRAPLPQRVVAMPGMHRLGEVRDAGIRFASGDERFRVGHAKLYVEDDADPRFVASCVDAAHSAGWPVAMHVLDVGPLEHAITALERSAAPEGTHDRLEHVALSLPEQVERIGARGVHVVTQPSFLARRGAKYLSELSDVELDMLYRVRSLRDAGVIVAGSSDAPVVPSVPLEVVAAAILRRSGDVAIGPAEGVDAQTACYLVTRDAAVVCRMAAGALAPGMLGDVVVLDRNPFRVDATEIAGIRVVTTIIGGEVVWHAATG